MSEDLMNALRESAAAQKSAPASDGPESGHLFEVSVRVPLLGCETTAYADDAGGAFLALDCLFKETATNGAQGRIRNLALGEVVFDGSRRDMLRSNR